MAEQVNSGEKYVFAAPQCFAESVNLFYIAGRVPRGRCIASLAMRIGTAAAVLALVCLSTVPSSVFAKKDHVLVISGEAEFEKAVKVTVLSASIL